MAENFAALCRGTPTLVVVDNRGLVIRTMAFNRSQPQAAAELMINRCAYNATANTKQNWDARFFNACKKNTQLKANFVDHCNLSAQVLRSESVDSGWLVALKDAEGRPVWQCDARGTQQTIRYEGAETLGRPLMISEREKAKGWQVIGRFVYAQSTAQDKAHNLCAGWLRHYDPAGMVQRISVSIAGAECIVQRQLLADCSHEADWQGEDEQAWQAKLAPDIFRTQRVMDAMGDVLSQLDSQGNQQRFAYDCAGQLAGEWLTIKGRAEQVTLQQTSYHVAGMLQRYVAGNGVVSCYQYDKQNLRLIRAQVTRPASNGENARLLQDLNYQYDAVGNIVSACDKALADIFHNNQKITPENHYSYDALYQLISASGSEAASNQAPANRLPAFMPLAASGELRSNYTRNYQYDNSGNLLEIRHNGAANYSCRFAISELSNHSVFLTNQEQYTSAQIEAQFDICGNQCALISGAKLAWNGRNQLSQVTAANNSEHYLYDGEGNRVVKQCVDQNGNRHQVIYLPGLELHSKQQNGKEIEKWQVVSMGAARALYWQLGCPDGIENGQLRYSVADQLGSVQLELDNKGSIISLEAFYPYGGSAYLIGRNEMEVAYKTRRYSGKERDASGLYYYGYRYYQPWAGRWLSADPTGPSDGFNLYRMVCNNPIRFSDYMGLMITGEAARVAVAERFILDSHMQPIEEAASELGMALSFREAGEYTIKALRAGGAAKGHNILEKTIKPGSVENAYRKKAKDKDIMNLAEKLGIAGSVGHWVDNEIKGVWVHDTQSGQDKIVHFDIEKPETQAAYNAAISEGLITPYTGDYDMHDIIKVSENRVKGVRQRGYIPEADSAEELHVKDVINRKVAARDKNRPFEAEAMNVIRHGPQVNFVPHMLQHEAEKVQKDGGVLAAVAKPGAFPIAFVHQNQWTIIESVEEHRQFYKEMRTHKPLYWKREKTGKLYGFDTINKDLVMPKTHARFLARPA